MGRGEIIMKKQVLFIQGGGEGAHTVDEKLAAALQDALGAEYNVVYPHMPDENDPQYETWAAQIAQEQAALGDEVIIVGHSAGGAVLLRHLSEAKSDKPLAGIFVIAAPYWGAEDWQADLPAGLPVFLYHSRDDRVVPFAHLAQFAEKVPQATIREFDGRGHQFNHDLSEVAEDIKALEVHKRF
jgi:predicted alpha/beta hydrolase family esterase